MTSIQQYILKHPDTKNGHILQAYANVQNVVINIIGVPLAKHSLPMALPSWE
jgi:hypothetical protein